MKKLIISIMVALMSFTSTMFARELSYDEWLRDQNLTPTEGQKAQVRQLYDEYVRQTKIFERIAPIQAEIASVQGQLRNLQSQSQPDDDTQDKIADLRKRLRDLEAEKERLEREL